MTAEIVIMNKGAIALAADSAVTMQHQGGAKIYDSANKLFMLSKYQPVGIMVYGAVEFTGIPWETIVKEYRRRLSKKQFSKLSDYAADFLAFLTCQSELFSKEERERFVRRTIWNCYIGLRDKIDKEVKVLTDTKGKVTDTQIRRLTSNVITKAWKFFHEAERLPCFIKLEARVLAKKYNKIVSKLKQAVFEKLPLSNTLQKKLDQLAINLFLKDVLIDPYSGVVIAGFGPGFPG